MKNLLVFVLSLFSAANVAAQAFETAETVKMTVSASADGKMVVNDFMETAQPTDEAAFANALIWSVNEMCTMGHDAVSEINVERKSFSARISIKSSDAASKNIYRCNASFRVADGIMLYDISDIVAESEVVVIKKSTPFEKLQPEKKPAHKEMIADFEKSLSSVMSKMFSFVQSNEIAYDIHWDLISAGQVKKGMNESEVLMSLGKPLLVSGNRDKQWKYSDSMYVLFKDGVVKSVLR